MIDNGKINRPDSMTPFHNIVKGAEKAGSHLIKEGLKDTTKYAPTIGSALGGAGLGYLAGNALGGYGTTGAVLGALGGGLLAGF